MNSETERAFLAAVQACPTDRTTRLVYADWLDEHGDIRAELLRALVLQEADPSNPTHHERIRQLRRQVDPLWLVAIGDTQARLKNIAKVLDSREGENFFNYVNSLCAYPGTALQLKCKGSCVGIHQENLLLDLEICAHATDPQWRGNLEEDLQNSAERIRDVGAFIASPEVAPAIRSLYLWTTVAANGTAEIYLDGYVTGSGQFTNMKRFATNFSNEDGECIIASIRTGHGYDEAGLLAKLLDKCPTIEDLVIPSAPNHDFFSVGIRPVKRLRVKAGYATQDFILNLSRSDCFPQLEELDYRDCDLNTNDWRQRATPFQHFVTLFRSPALASMHAVTLTDVLLTDSEVQELLSIRREGVTIHPNRRR
jgi:uncharacterized protein (TIGR02996 family)